MRPGQAAVLLQCTCASRPCAHKRAYPRQGNHPSGSGGTLRGGSRGEPSGALVALKKAAKTGTGLDAARAGLLVVGRLEDAAEGGPWAELAAAHAREAGDSILQGQAWMAVGDARFESDSDGARTAYAAALEAWGQSPQSLPWRATVTWNLGLLAWNAGDADEARARLRAAKVLAVEAGQDADARQIGAQLEGMEPAAGE